MVTRLESRCASISTGAQSGGHGGLTADAERVILRNGSTVVIRPLGAGDEAAIASWFAGLSAEARYARFLGSWSSLIAGPSLRLRVWTTSIMRRSRRSPPTEPRSESRATSAPAGAGRRGRGCGGRRLAGSGIARILLERIATRARSVGIEPFTVMCLATNNTVVRLLSRLGPTAVGPSDGGLVDVRIDLTGTRPDRCASGPAGGGRRD